MVSHTITHGSQRMFDATALGDLPTTDAICSYLPATCQQRGQEALPRGPEGHLALPLTTAGGGDLQHAQGRFASLQVPQAHHNPAQALKYAVLLPHSECYNVAYTAAT